MRKWHIILKNTAAVKSPPTSSISTIIVTHITILLVCALLIHAPYIRESYPELPPKLDLWFPNMRFNSLEWDNKSRKSFRGCNHYIREAIAIYELLWGLNSTMVMRYYEPALNLLKQCTSFGHDEWMCGVSSIYYVRKIYQNLSVHICQTIMFF